MIRSDATATATSTSTGGWVGRDMVGIDAGAAVLALDNVLRGDRVRAVFHGLPCVQRGLERLGFTRVAAVRQAS